MLIDERLIGAAQIPVRIYIPTRDAAYPVLIYYHGGGWVRGDLNMSDHTCRAIGDNAPCVVVNVGYRLAPEFPFPTPMLDCYDALVWTAEHATEFKGDPLKLAVAGSSAGGNLAAAVALRARDLDGPQVALQCLVYPPLDARMETESYRTKHDASPHLTTEAMAAFWSQYIPDPAQRDGPYASPGSANSVADTPATWLAIADRDPTCDEIAAYAERLRSSGVPVTEVHYPEQGHGFVAVAPDDPDTHDVHRRIAAAIATTFGE